MRREEVVIRVRVKHYLLIDVGPTRMRENTLILREGNVAELIEALKQQYGRKIEEYLLNPLTGELQRGILILINGVNALSMGGLNARLNDGDEVMIIPAVAGG